jgi:DNA helicase IV
VVLGVAEVKGLEFDTVVLVEPAEILAGSPRGVNDLYVALTRPTQRLHVLASAPLPPGLESLATPSVQRA